MKFILVLAATLASGTVFANEANHFTCHSTKEASRKASAILSTSNIAGKISLNLTFEEKDATSAKMVEKTLSGMDKDVTVTKSPIGKLYTVKHGAKNLATVAIPSVTVKPGQVAIESTLVLTEVHTADHVTNSFVPLKCEAGFVQSLQ